jgi:hypothetical protein
MTTIIATMTMKTLKDFINCTSSCSSKRNRLWTSCLFKSFFEFWTAYVFSTTFEKKSTFTSYMIFDKLISINDLERSIYVMKQKTIRVICRIDNKRLNIFFRHFLRFEMYFKFDQFWLIKRDLFLHVAQIEFIHDQRLRHHNKKTH